MMMRPSGSCRVSFLTGLTPPPPPAPRCLLGREALSLFTLRLGGKWGETVTFSWGCAPALTTLEGAMLQLEQGTGNLI